MSGKFELLGLLDEKGKPETQGVEGVVLSGNSFQKVFIGKATL